MWIFYSYISEEVEIDSKTAARIEANKIDVNISFDEEKNDDDDSLFDDLRIYLEPNKNRNNGNFL